MLVCLFVIHVFSLFLLQITVIFHFISTILVEQKPSCRRKNAKAKLHASERTLLVSSKVGVTRANRTRNKEIRINQKEPFESKYINPRVIGMEHQRLPKRMYKKRNRWFRRVKEFVERRGEDDTRWRLVEGE